MTTTADTRATARRVWGWLADETRDPPLPPFMALEMVMDAGGERGAAKAALTRAAGKWLEQLPNDNWSETAGMFLDSLRRGNINRDADAVLEIFRINDPDTWGDWCARAERALALLRAVREVPV
jgi:hypothetical protein